MDRRNLMLMVRKKFLMFNYVDRRNVGVEKKFLMFNYVDRRNVGVEKKVTYV